MKLFYFVVSAALLSCNDAPRDKSVIADDDSAPKSDSLPAKVPDSLQVDKTPGAGDSTQSKTYANQRFRDVTIHKTGEDKYVVAGEAQIFEANFSWVVEDGHNELLSGHQTTDAGAPEWGKFSFTVEVKKARPNSTLILILFESSPKDGSRHHELPIVLEQ